MGLVVRSPAANAGDVRDAGSIPGSGRSPGGGHGNPLQYSGLGNPMDRKIWWVKSMGPQRMGHELGTNEQLKYKWKPLTNHISKFLTTAQIYCPGSALLQESRQRKIPSF